MNLPSVGKPGTLWRNPLARWLYNLLFPLVFLLSLPAYLRRMIRRGNYRRNFGQRFGLYSNEVRARLDDGPARMWLQAVSVGEMMVALKLIDALRERQPGLPLILSTTTTTGYALALERAGAGVEVVYTPIDLAGAVRRAFDVLRPGQIVIVDGGLWPNLLWEARRRGVRTSLVNARLSPRSERRFRRFRWISAPLFRLLDLVCVCEPGDVSRWQELGVPAIRLRHTGSIKFDDSAANDLTPARAQERGEFLDTLGINADAPVLLAASTHPGEEKMIAGVFLRLRDRFPGLRLYVAPRHVERAREVRGELEALGLKVAARTEALGLTAADRCRLMPVEVLLLDTTGELRAWYTAATVVFIGKSLAAIGGQSPAEAVAAGRPVMFGPHMENFPDLTAALLASGGAVQIRDQTDLEAECARLLADPEARSRMAASGRRQLEAHRGAARRTAGELLTPK